MRLLTSIVPAGLAITTLAAPNKVPRSNVRLPAVGSPAELAAQAFDSAQAWLYGAIQQTKHEWEKIESGASEKLKAEQLRMDGIECESSIRSR